MKAFPLIALMFLSVSVKSQSKDQFYVFDDQWKAAKIENAKFFLRVKQISDTCWEWDYYHFTGPMLKSERFQDKEGQVLNGVSRHYNEDGQLDSTSMFVQGRKNGEFLKVSGDSLRITAKYIYKDDSLVEFIDLSRNKKDSSTKYPDEREAEYPGKIGKWMKYLNKNLQYPERAISIKAEGTVRISFLIDKEGTVIDPFVSRSVEYSLDEEASRIIRASGKWISSFANGKLVTAYKIQPIFFKFQ